MLVVSGGTPAWVTPSSQAGVLSVFLSADQAVTANAYNTIIFNGVYLNTIGGGSYSAATGIFTVPVAGMYRITAHCGCVSGNIGVQLVHAGAQVAFGPGAVMDLAWLQYMSEVTQIRSCAAGDTIYASVYGNAANTLKGIAATTFMTIDLIK